jgi:hypothetical protein
MKSRRLQSPSARIPPEEEIVVEQEVEYLTRAAVDDIHGTITQLRDPRRARKALSTPGRSGHNRKTTDGDSWPFHNRGGRDGRVGLKGRRLAMSQSAKSCDGRRSAARIDGRTRRTEDVDGPESCSFSIASRLSWDSREIRGAPSLANHSHSPLTSVRLREVVPLHPAGEHGQKPMRE